MGLHGGRERAGSRRRRLRCVDDLAAIAPELVERVPTGWRCSLPQTTTPTPQASLQMPVARRTIYPFATHDLLPVS